MKGLILLALLVPDVAAAQLQRQDRQDTIYVLRGDKGALETFKRNVGAEWTGGTIVDDDPSDGTLSYWAYTDRTAAESRALMIPAIMGGLQMDFEKYEEAKQFPAERIKLDQIAIKCGARTDPFFLTPKRSVEITQASGADITQMACLSDGVRLDARLPTTALGRQKKN